MSYTFLLVGHDFYPLLETELKEIAKKKQSDFAAPKTISNIRLRGMLNAGLENQKEAPKNPEGIATKIIEDLMQTNNLFNEAKVLVFLEANYGKSGQNVTFTKSFFLNMSSKYPNMKFALFSGSYNQNINASHTDGGVTEDYFKKVVGGMDNVLQFHINKDKITTNNLEKGDLWRALEETKAAKASRRKGSYFGPGGPRPDRFKIPPDSNELSNDNENELLPESPNVQRELDKRTQAAGVDLRPPSSPKKGIESREHRNKEGKTSRFSLRNLFKRCLPALKGKK